MDTNELKKLAEAAPEGPWFGPEYAPGTSYVFDVDLGSLLHYESIDTEQDACLRYVAAANPAVVLALIAENSRLAALLECSQGDMRQADKIMDRDRLDAERYRWIRDGAGYCDTRDIPGMAPGRMDAFIDAALGKEADNGQA